LSAHVAKLFALAVEPGRKVGTVVVVEIGDQFAGRGEHVRKTPREGVSL
jgi:hypothetical protein